MRDAPCTNALRRVAGFGVRLLGAVSLLGASQAWALNITSAVWNDSRNQLQVSGDEAGFRATVNVFDADTEGFLASDDANRRGSWSIRETLSSPPCHVRAESGSDSAEADVSPAPSNCSGGGNTPPTADPNGPYTGTVGSAVSFSSAGSVDPDAYLCVGGHPPGDPDRNGRRRRHRKRFDHGDDHERFGYAVRPGPKHLHQQHGSERLPGRSGRAAASGAQQRLQRAGD